MTATEAAIQIGVNPRKVARLAHLLGVGIRDGKGRLLSLDRREVERIRPLAVRDRRGEWSQRHRKQCAEFCRRRWKKRPGSSPSA